MSAVTDGSNPFMRRHNELLWVLSDKSDIKLSQIPIDFPPMVVNVFDSILLRGDFCKGVRAIQIEENFGTHPDNFGADPNNPISISVMHIGERIPLNDSNENLTSLRNMIANFPPSYYEIEINDAVAAMMYNQVRYNSYFIFLSNWLSSMH